MSLQPGTLGSIAVCRVCYAFVGLSVAVTIPHHIVTFRVELSCSGKPVGVPKVQGAGSILKMPEDVPLVSVGIASGSFAEESNFIAVA